MLGLVEDLLRETGASRVTLRHGEGFPVAEEALAPGVPSIRDEQRVDLRTQPVAIEVTAGRQVVQHDSASAYSDPAYQRMLVLYGGLAAQIVTPVMRDGEVAAILSVHQLGRTRTWTEAEIEACRRTAEKGSERL